MNQAAWWKKEQAKHLMHLKHRSIHQDKAKNAAAWNISYFETSRHTACSMLWVKQNSTSVAGSERQQNSLPVKERRGKLLKVYVQGLASNSWHLAYKSFGQCDRISFQQRISQLWAHSVMWWDDKLVLPSFCHRESRDIANSLVGCYDGAFWVAFPHLMWNMTW
jgi:hypothetical protein